jgi:mannan endo-1,4-beta-mannosidase
MKSQFREPNVKPNFTAERISATSKIGGGAALQNSRSRRRKEARTTFRTPHSAFRIGLGLVTSAATTLLFSAVLTCNAAHAAEPANPKANAQARAILNYFHELPAKAEKRILSGQFSDFGNGANLRLLERIHEKTGHWPALIGVDYADFGRGSLTYQVPNRVAIDYWKQGGLVSVMAHMYNPANPKGGGLRDQGVNIEDLLKPDTETHTRWMQQLDLMATGLKELQDAGVVVLWRPFHEMNGGWFWWGAKDPDTFIKVWRHMFDYFTETKGLNNLLWVYGPNHGQKTAAYYAGDRYVDLVGLDAYTDFIDPEHIKGYAEVAALPKPFGFTEFGPFGSRNPPGDYDYRRFIEGLNQHFAKTSFFMSWNAKWSLATNLYTKELLSDPRVANRDDLPAGLVKGRPDGP